MVNIVMSPEAENDLVLIGDYITHKLMNPKNAIKTIRNIKNRIDVLVDFPLIGTPLTAIVTYDTDYRFLGSGSYVYFDILIHFKNFTFCRGNNFEGYFIFITTC